MRRLSSIAMLVVAVAACGDDDDDGAAPTTTTAPPQCLDAAAVAPSISEGFGRPVGAIDVDQWTGTLDGAKALQIEPVVFGQEGSPGINFVVAGTATGPEIGSVVGVWAVDSLDAGADHTIWAIDENAQSVSVWLSAATPDSPMDVLRDEIAALPEASQVVACVDQ